MSARDDDGAIFGTNPLFLRSFPMSFTGTSARTAAALAAGGYVLRATQDCWCVLGDSSVTAAAVGATTTQPAINGAFKVFANTDKVITVPSGKHLAVIRDSADGSLFIEGPWVVQA